MQRILILLTMVLVSASCEKEIEIDLNSSDPKIVIEGTITDAPGPYFVKIYKTINFSAANDYPGVTDAFVTISDNTGIIDTLSEVANGLYRTKNIIGQPGNTYELKIAADGKQMSGSSTMPKKVNLDSLRFNAFSNENDYRIIPVFRDPDTLGNKYRYVQTVNGELDKAFLVQNDVAINGTVNKLPIFNPEAEITVGDTVTIEMHCIDQSTYDYFYTLSSLDGNLLGSATPSNPNNNIIGDYALGLFSAHTVQKVTQIVD